MNNILFEVALFVAGILVSFIYFIEKKSNIRLFSTAVFGFLFAIVTELLYRYNIVPDIPRVILLAASIVLVIIGTAKPNFMQAVEIVKAFKSKKK